MFFSLSITILYSDDDTLITDNDNNLQIPLFGFHKDCIQFDLKMSTSKTKALTNRQGVS